MNTTQRHIGTAATLCLACALALPSASLAATWNQKAADTYDWPDTANWTDGTLPTADDDANFGGLPPTDYRPSGNQTITGDGTARSMDFQNNAWNRSRTFTGNITASNLVLRLGTVNIDGTLTLTGTDQTYSLIGAAANAEYIGGTLNIREGGTVRADGVHALSIGRRFTADTSPAAGRVVLEDGGALVLNPSGSTATIAGLAMGRTDGSRTANYSASYVQKGGSATIGRIIASFEKNAYSSLDILGGSLYLPVISDSASYFRIGHHGYATFQLHGGEVNIGTNRANVNLSTAKRTYGFEIGSGQTDAQGLKGAAFYADGGSFNSAIDFVIQGQSYDLTGVNPAYATIDGTACVTSRTVRVGGKYGDGAAYLNLNGGSLVTDFIAANPGRSGTSEINANGGNLVFRSGAAQFQFLGIDAINIYEDGLLLDVSRNGRVDIGNALTNVYLKTPDGYGIDIASVTETASSFTPPWIGISGGSGSGASAIALVNFDTDKTTNAVVTCRGHGYAADDAPVATIYRPFGTTTFDNRVVLSVSTNLPGAFIKTGASELNLYSQPYFAGTYECRQGIMRQTTATGTASPNVAAVVVGGVNAQFQAGSGNATATTANWNPINPAATLTLGTTCGPGSLIVPAAASGETAPFEQSFASLTVNGTGNAITWANGNSHEVGTKLSFGTISCAEGSQLTIPAPTSTFKVYCTGMAAGTNLKNIVFEGDDAHTAMVGDDGQLVPMPLAFVMVVR